MGETRGEEVTLIGPGTLNLGDAALISIGGGLRNGVANLPPSPPPVELPPDGFFRVGNGGGKGKFAFLGIGKCNLRGVGIDAGVAFVVLLIFIDVDAANMADGVDGCDTTIG